MGNCTETEAETEKSSTKSKPGQKTEKSSTKSKPGQKWGKNADGSWGTPDKPADAKVDGSSKTTPMGKTREGGVYTSSGAAHGSGLSGGGDSTKGYESTKKWVEDKLGEKLGDDLWEWAHDGTRLCKLANKLKAGSVDIKKLNKMSIPFACMENIDRATAAFKTMLPKNQQGRLFRSPDLYEKNSSYPKQIWICLSALEKQFP